MGIERNGNRKKWALLQIEECGGSSQSQVLYFFSALEIPKKK
jgi:hypothetical protein